MGFFSRFSASGSRLLFSEAKLHSTPKKMEYFWLKVKIH